MVPMEHGLTAVCEFATVRQAQSARVEKNRDSPFFHSYFGRCVAIGFAHAVPSQVVLQLQLGSYT